MAGSWGGWEKLLAQGCLCSPGLGMEGGEQGGCRGGQRLQPEKTRQRRGHDRQGAGLIPRFPLCGLHLWHDSHTGFPAPSLWLGS